MNDKYSYKTLPQSQGRKPVVVWGFTNKEEKAILKLV